MGSTRGREVAGEAQPQRAGTSHSLSPGTASPTARAGQGRAGPGEPGRGPRARGAPAQERSRLTSGDQAGSSGGLGGSRAREKSPGPACLPLPHLLGRLSVTRGGGGGPGGGRLLIGSSAEAGGAVQPQLGSARRAGAGAGRPIPGRKHAQPRLPTPSLGITQPAAVSSRGLARAARVVPCFFLTFSP